MFAKILIANRGEIAVRIIRACKDMGIATVAVYSQADANSLHVAMADESYCIGGASATDSYLNEERILSTALVSGVQAIHPGYGFLSENAHFARQCLDKDLVFIGPSAKTMERLGDKIRVKELMAEAGLPVIPGSPMLTGMEDGLRQAERLGYPVMLKARSGGGGRGIRLVRSARELEGAYGAAQAEGAAAFKDGTLYLEKFVSPARHVEVQILADQSGRVVCLGERDCSIQLHNQKLMEETPSPALNAKQRRTLFRQITQAVERVGYTGAGTLEFLLDKAGNFYFMEMNVRLQVEHPVTEALTKIDLVKWQIRIACGIAMPFGQRNIHFYGCAVECRILARGPGKITQLHMPGGPFVRFDTYLVPGCEVTSWYDPLLGKLITWASTREEALRKMNSALCELVIEGIPTNLEEQLRILRSKDFQNGSYNLTYFSKEENAI